MTEKKNTVPTLCPKSRIPIGTEALNSVTGRVLKNKIIVFGDNPNE